MASFEQAFKITVNIEKGYVNDPDDRGGETKYGISKASFPNEDIPNLTPERAAELYKQFWWDELLLTEINNQIIANKIFDIAVNTSFPSNHKSIAITILQRAIRSATGMFLDEDGVIGQHTINATNACDYKGLIVALKSELAGYYRCLVVKNPVNVKYINGWLNRAYS
jgi:lysozyme family protein